MAGTKLSGAGSCRRKFLRAFPDGFRDETYVDWERGYKLAAHTRWQAVLARDTFARRLAAEDHVGIAADVVRVESRTNLLFSFEKMALRDAVREPEGARPFADGLFQWIHGTGTMEQRFTAWCDVVAALPRRQTRVFTWPVVTVFGFLADPARQIFLKPTVTRVAAERYGFPFFYQSRPDWPVYRSLLEFAATVRADLHDLRPRDMIDLQSFIWVQGSDEY